MLVNQKWQNSIPQNAELFIVGCGVARRFWNATGVRDSRLACGWRSLSQNCWGGFKCFVEFLNKNWASSSTSFTSYRKFCFLCFLSPLYFRSTAYFFSGKDELQRASPDQDIAAHFDECFSFSNPKYFANLRLKLFDNVKLESGAWSKDRNLSAQTQFKLIKPAANFCFFALAHSGEKNVEPHYFYGALPELSSVHWRKLYCFLLKVYEKSFDSECIPILFSNVIRRDTKPLNTRRNKNVHFETSKCLVLRLGPGNGL